MKRCNLMREIPLTQGQVALVDDEDYERVTQFKWCAQRADAYTYYAIRFRRDTDGRRRKIAMHQFITGFLLTDHHNHNGLDNRRDNLRDGTEFRNPANSRKQLNTSSSYKGVSWDKNYRQWQAKICKHRKTQFLGRFDSEIGAAIAYDNAATQLFGEYAYPNFRWDNLTGAVFVTDDQIPELSTA